MKYASISKLSYKQATEKNTVITTFFFSGSQQQDAHECFLLFVNIMRQGSKYSVLDPQENETEDGMVSLRNNIFYYVYQRNICCEICNSLTSSYQEYYVINISP